MQNKVNQQRIDESFIIIIKTITGISIIELFMLLELSMLLGNWN
jgi:hypothetical protein